jgi:predicted neuraminidase
MGLIQPSLYIDGKGSMNAFLRSSRGLGKIYHSHSEDKMNEMWSSPKPTKFLNPNSGIDCEYYNNRLFLVYNPSEIARNPLNLAELDEKTFDIIDEITIEKNIPEEEKTLSPELSYPYVVENDGKLHCVYTYGRSRIAYCSISI